MADVQGTFPDCECAGGPVRRVRNRRSGDSAAHWRMRALSAGAGSNRPGSEQVWIDHDLPCLSQLILALLGLLKRRTVWGQPELLARARLADIHALIVRAYNYSVLLPLLDGLAVVIHVGHAD